MAEKEKDILDELESEGVNKKDFEYVLQQVLDAHQPILEEELKRAASATELIEEAKNTHPDCDDEIALADRLFAPFDNEEVTLRLLTEDLRKKFGSIDQWRWCHLHIICCLKFGWLLHRARSFRAAAYYLYRFWICIRALSGKDTADRRLTVQEKADFKTLVEALSAVYKPYLKGELSVANQAGEIADQATEGQLSCESGMAEAEFIFNNFLTPQLAPALLGEKAMEKYQQHPIFWFCRCWCLCATKFGWCLASAHNLLDVFYCLVRYFRCLIWCRKPLICEITDPVDCAAEEINTDVTAYVVAVKGSVGGGNFDHYILEWSSDSVIWNSSDFHYPPVPPGGGTQGNTPVNANLLAFFDTTARDSGLYFIRMTVYSNTGVTKVCNTRFTLFKKDVRILGVNGYTNLDTSEHDPAAKLVETIPKLCSRPKDVFEMSFARCISIQGSAFVGGCTGKKIKHYMLDFKEGYEADPLTGGWTNFWNVDYNTVWQYRDMNMRKDTDNLTSRWVDDCVIGNPFPPPHCLLEIADGRLAPSCWNTKNTTCERSGLYTIRLVVEDTDGNLYYDTQRLWIDNKHVCAMIRINAAKPCSDINISDFASPPDCNTPWNLPLEGIAYDEYIDDTLPLTRPNDNFDLYWIKVAKQGGSQVDIPISISGGSPCFYGTSRVGNPGSTCNPCDPASPDPSAIFGLLAQFDLRALDPVCHTQVPYLIPANLLLPRGECCVYYFKLHARDTTTYAGGPHWDEDIWPVKICNNLK